MLLDLFDNLDFTNVVPPQTATNSNTAVNSTIVDLMNARSVVFDINVGPITNSNATLVPSLTEGNDPALADGATVAAGDMLGTIAGATFGGSAQGNTANTGAKVGYIGSKRYVRLTLTPTLNQAGAITFQAAAVKGNLRKSAHATQQQ